VLAPGGGDLDGWIGVDFNQIPFSNTLLESGAPFTTLFFFVTYEWANKLERLVVTGVYSLV